MAEVVWDWSFVDRVVYINLKFRTDRNEQIKAVFQEVGIPEEKILRFEAIHTKPGDLGCLKSHKAVLEMALKNKWKNILVIEDDMVFDLDNESIVRCNAFFDKLKKISWDAAFLAASYYIINNVEDELFRVKFAYLSNSYLVNAHYYETLIENFSDTINGKEVGTIPNGLGVDASWLKLMKRDNWYGIYPCVGYQRTGVSDIDDQGRVMDRHDQFTRHLDSIRKYGSG
ncbi:glycosyltransferase family 25 protein [Enterobacteriaceae bacterium LUAb1]